MGHPERAVVLWRSSQNWGSKATEEEKDVSLSLSYYLLLPLIKFSQKPEGKEAYAETV